jgi:hypothetical protein
VGDVAAFTFRTIYSIHLRYGLPESTKNISNIQKSIFYEPNPSSDIRTPTSYLLVLAATIMLNHQTIIKLVVAIAAGITGMLFRDAQYQIINNHNERYTKRTLEEQDQQHFESIPFAGPKQGRS